ncbi:hypothetical protein [Rhizobium laguerreae]|uniref:hypothetical protein n=1 Tax=Rhizobium laguerreae TaxID=1076926 RepID=UPI00144189F6|nr:hypothetical protein [Rhizobium laguerreae]NKN08612.1 hypothetical protein [Rhizobium laguerreae]
MGVRKAIALLEKHYGFDEFRHSADAMTDAILVNAIGHFAQRAARRGERSQVANSIFDACCSRRRRLQVSGPALSRLTQRFLGTMSFTLHQFRGNDEYHLLEPIIDRNRHDPFFRHYIDYIWPFHRNSESDRAMAWLSVARAGPETAVQSFGGGQLLNSGALFSGAMSTVGRGVLPLSRNHDLLDGLSVVDVMNEAIAYDATCRSAHLPMKIGRAPKCPWR